MNANTEALAEIIAGFLNGYEISDVAELLDAAGVRAPVPTSPMDEIAPEDRAPLAELERVAAIRDAVVSWESWGWHGGRVPMTTALVLAEHLYAQGIRAGVPDDDPADELDITAGYERGEVFRAIARGTADQSRTSDDR